HAHDGWTRLNFYSSRGAVRELKRLITAALRPAAPGEQVIFSHPADAAGISAGGLSFAGISMLALQKAEPGALLERLRERVPELKLLDPCELQPAADIRLGTTYLALYSERLPALLELAPFGQSPQLAISGVCRERDAYLIADWSSELAKVQLLMDVPAPLCSVEDDDRAAVRIFMLRAPLRAGAEHQLSTRLMVWPGIRLYDIGSGR
ncbi:MAG: hypothetical protein ACYC55_09700, partial [Candidatus Geothermincolia bacterium]